MVKGHAIYIDSEWALTLISQRQFWRGFDFEQTGDGRVGGDPRGRRLGLGAAQPPAGRDRDAVLTPTRCSTRCGRSSPTTSTGPRRGANVVHALPDPAIEFPNPTEAANLEPLLVNTDVSSADRPDAVTRDPEPLPRLGLRAHPHRPGPDGGRRRGGAARRQRDPEATGSSAPRCESGRCASPARSALARAIDSMRWKLFQPSRQAAAAGDGRPAGSSRPGRSPPGSCA